MLCRVAGIHQNPKLMLKFFIQLPDTDRLNYYISLDFFTIMVKIIIEHLDARLWKWSLLEYRHVSDYVGKVNVIFTNIKSDKAGKMLAGLGEVHRESVKQFNKTNACILDPDAKVTLAPSDQFDYLVLGGILGDFPMKRRTRKELSDVLPWPARNLGHYQMSTNTAAIVAWKIMHGTPMERLKFIRRLKIKVNEFEEVILPYRFLLEDGKPVLPEGYIEIAKKSW